MWTGVTCMSLCRVVATGPKDALCVAIDAIAARMLADNILYHSVCDEGAANRSAHSRRS